MKKKVHVVSHSHWDREWYLPLENLRMRLVDLIDNVIEASDDGRFKSFQLDGHFLPVEDYLEVKPQNREKVYELIKNGKIKVGPWYILQDSFLTSGESNVRNLEIGLKECKKIGRPAMIGYFPDTFGNIGQAPQILKKAGINNAFFGRGVKATGFANAVIEDYSSRNSELHWKSPDGSTVLGVLLANWYCNGLDMPSDKEALKAYLDIRIKDMEKFASTRHLLLMNGCDHSPVQKNIGEIIEIANTLYEDYEFVHSDLETYVKEVKSEIDEDNIDTVKGELRSQMTDGYGTLTNTSSSRYDLKYLNKMVEMRLEEVIQPLYTLYLDKEEYPRDKINYVYKHLLTNHTHDAICGCSIDSVHEGNLRRFRNCMETLDYLEGEAKNYLRKNIVNSNSSKNLDGKDTSEDVKGKQLTFNVINTTAYQTRKITQVTLDVQKIYSQGFSYHEDIKKLKDIEISAMSVSDGENTYDAKVLDLGVNFGYDLPKSTFRRPYFARQIKVEFVVELKPFENRQFTLIKSSDVKVVNNISGEKISDNKISDNKIVTDFYEIEINNNSSLRIKDLRNNRIYDNVLMLEDSGDIGNEYIYKEAHDKKRVYGSQIIDVDITNENSDVYQINIKEIMKLPKSADGKLEEEQRYLVDFKDRLAGRSEEFVDLRVNKTIRIDKHSSTIDVEMDIENNVLDHRLRVLFGHEIKNEEIFAESIFEVAKRRATPPTSWKNEDYTQNFNRFIQVKDENGGLTVSSIGVAEYENKEEGLYLTLYRAVGELGDWGYFKTEDSQMLKKMHFKLYLDIFNDEGITSQSKVLSKRVPYITTQVEEGEMLSSNSTVDIDIKNNMFSTLYQNDDGNKILRIYNPNEVKQEISNIDGELYNIIGTEPCYDNYSKEYVDAFEIRTLKLKE